VAPTIERIDSGCASNPTRVLIRLTAPTASLQSVQFRPHYPAEKHTPLTIFSFDTHDPPKEQTVYSGDLFYVK
jgi:hypothetical protein